MSTKRSSHLRLVWNQAAPPEDAPSEELALYETMLIKDGWRRVTALELRSLPPDAYCVVMDLTSVGGDRSVWLKDAPKVSPSEFKS